MTRSDLFKTAHQLTKATIQEGDDYRVTFGACLKLARKMDAEGWNWTGCKWEQECGPDAEWTAVVAVYKTWWGWVVYTPQVIHGEPRHAPMWDGCTENLDHTLRQCSLAMNGGARWPWEAAA